MHMQWNGDEKDECSTYVPNHIHPHRHATDCRNLTWLWRLMCRLDDNDLRTGTLIQTPHLGRAWLATLWFGNTECVKRSRPGFRLS